MSRPKGTFKAIPLGAIAPDQRLITAGELARIFGVTRRTLHNWTQTGVLPTPLFVNHRKYWDPAVLPQDVAGVNPRAPRAFDRARYEEIKQ